MLETTPPTPLPTPVVLRRLATASRVAKWLLVVVSAWGATSTGHAQNAQPISAEQVRAAIERGVRYLRAEQDGLSGEWRNPTSVAQHRGGMTALCTLALLNAGLSPDDPTIRNGLDALDRLEIDDLSVYTVSLMAMCYAAADPLKHRPRIAECVAYLEEQQFRDGPDVGGWSYGSSPSNPDASNSQFALLGLHEAAVAGVPVDADVWLRAKQYWSRVWDQRSGGFFYTTSLAETTGSMTCAGVSSVIIIDENLARDAPLDANGNIQCCGGDDVLVQVDMACDWLGSRFSVRRNPTQRGARTNGLYYYLYGMERAGRLSGRRFFGDHDWYREGAEYLVRAQAGNGAWESRSQFDGLDTGATAFALLFLSKGRRPIVVGKYRHGDDADWDRHPKGVHYLVRHLEQDWQTKLNWQVVDGRVAETEDLLESPVLFISGRDALALTDRQKASLKSYIEYGGFLFIEACAGDGCGDAPEFDAAVRTLVAELVPDNPLRPLEPGHPIWTAQHKLLPDAARPLLGVQASCRTSIVYCPANLACLWQANQPAMLPRMNDTARAQVDYATRLGINVITYATGRQLREKLDQPRLANTAGTGAEMRVIEIPKLAHNGGSDDAPNAWQNLLRRAQFDLRQPIQVAREIIPIEPAALADHPMVFMHGRSELTFTPQEREALSEYLRRGGFLLCDAICSSTTFADSFRREMQLVFPNEQLQRIPADHPMWSTQFGGYDLAAVGLHRPARGGGQTERRATAPLMEGVTIDGRLAVVFSPYDLSCAMENASPDQCEGYDQDDAARLGVNIILYALSQ
jgi:hypothetical protein